MPQPRGVAVVDRQNDEHGLVDADRFLTVAEQLRELHARVEEAKVSSEQKARWQRRIIAITNAAKTDLSRADDQLVRFTAELDRHLKRR